MVRKSTSRPIALTEKGDHSLSQPEMVLVAFFRVAGGSTQRVPYEELVLQAWKDFPQAFSLRNHPEHPDASDIHKKLYQSLKPSGLVVPLGNKVFRLTDQGVERAEELLALLDGDSVKGAPPARLSRSEEAFLQRAFQSRAYLTWAAGEGERLVDYDARMFFQFTTGTSIQERKRKVEFAKASIEKARELGVDGAAELKFLADHLTEAYPQLFAGA